MTFWTWACTACGTFLHVGSSIRPNMTTSTIKRLGALCILQTDRGWNSHADIRRKLRAETCLSHLAEILCTHLTFWPTRITYMAV